MKERRGKLYDVATRAAEACAERNRPVFLRIGVTDPHTERLAQGVLESKPCLTCEKRQIDRRRIRKKTGQHGGSCRGGRALDC